MHQLRMWLAAVTTVAVLAASGATFAQAPAPGAPGQPKGNGGAGPSQVQPWQQAPGGLRHGTPHGQHGTFRANHGAANVRHVPGNRPNFGPPLRRFPIVPPATCFAMTAVSGTVAAVYQGSLSVVEADGQTVTLPFAPNVVVTRGGVPVPAAALGAGETVDVTVTCQGWASAISIVG